MTRLNMSWAASAALNTLPRERARSLKEAFAVYLFKGRSTRRATSDSYPTSLGDGSGPRRVVTQTTDPMQRNTRRASLQAPNRKC